MMIFTKIPLYFESGNRKWKIIYLIYKNDYFCIYNFYVYEIEIKK